MGISNANKWAGGLVEWEDGETVYMSVAFTWRLPDAYQRAQFWRAMGRPVVAGGPDCKHLVFTAMPRRTGKTTMIKRLISDESVKVVKKPAEPLKGTVMREKIDVTTMGSSVKQTAWGVEKTRTGGSVYWDQTFMGLKVLTDPNMVETVEDWSDCRSPSRARRRLKRGFPQHVKYRSVPLSPVRAGEYIIMHPETYRALRLEEVMI